MSDVEYLCEPGPYALEGASSHMFRSDSGRMIERCPHCKSPAAPIRKADRARLKLQATIERTTEKGEEDG